MDDGVRVVLNHTGVRMILVRVNLSMAPVLLLGVLWLLGRHYVRRLRGMGRRRRLSISILVSGVNSVGVSHVDTTVNRNGCCVGLSVRNILLGGVVLDLRLYMLMMEVLLLLLFFLLLLLLLLLQLLQLLLLVMLIYRLLN